MSLSAALSIFAPPPGLAPNGGEGASGDDGLFAGLIEVETAAAQPPVAAKGAPAGHADDLEAVIAGTDDGAASPLDPPVVAPPIVPFTTPVQWQDKSEAMTAATSAADVDPEVDRTLPLPPPSDDLVGSEPAISKTVLTPADAAPANDSQMIAEKPPAGAVQPADKGPTIARAVLEAHLPARPRAVTAERSSVSPTGTPEAESTTPGTPIDAAIVKAVRVPHTPPPAAFPSLAPALAAAAAAAAAVQDGGNAPVISPEDSTAETTSAPGSGRAAGAQFTPPSTSTAVTETPDIARPQPEIAPLGVTEPSTDPIGTEGRVESPPETAPATPAAVNASGLSRASIETTAILAAQIARRLEGRSTRFDMALTPEGLGRVDVRVEIDADGQLAARLAFDNPAAATDLRGRADELRRQLEDAGFTLARDALNFSEREPSSGGQGAFERRQRRAYAHRLSSEPDLAAAPVAWSPHSTAPRGVDVKV